jgi:hypothetical protein
MAILELTCKIKYSTSKVILKHRHQIVEERGVAMLIVEELRCRETL